VLFIDLRRLPELIGLRVTQANSGACCKKRNREDRPPALVFSQYHQSWIVVAAAFLKLPNKVTGVIERSLVAAG
jgi:hypothetical protein